MRCTILTCSFALLLTGSVAAGGADIRGELRAVLQQYHTAVQKKDVATMLSCIHTNSSQYGTTRAFADYLFSLNDVEIKLVEFKFIGTDGEYATAVVDQQVSDRMQKSFNSNITQSHIAFRREGTAWKLWKQKDINVTYVDAGFADRPSDPELQGLTNSTVLPISGNATGNYGQSLMERIALDNMLKKIDENRRGDAFELANPYVAIRHGMSSNAAFAMYEHFHHTRQTNDNRYGPAIGDGLSGRGLNRDSFMPTIPRTSQ